MSEEEVGLKLPTKEFIMSMEVGDFLVLEGQKFKLSSYVRQNRAKWFFSRNKTAEELARDTVNYKLAHIRSNRDLDNFVAAFEKHVLAEIISTGQYMIE